MATLLILGATGLVGGSALDLALGDGRVDRVIAPTRRPLAAHTRLDNPVVDFETLPVDAPWWTVDAVICALGSTMRSAGSRDAFRRVDHDYPLVIANITRPRGARAFALVSSIGASSRARSFYLRTKGETEDAIRACHFPSLTIVRPSLIDGDRPHKRPLESIGLAVARTLDPLLPRRYRVVHAQGIARALLHAALEAPDGEHIIESDSLQSF